MRTSCRFPLLAVALLVGGVGAAQPAWAQGPEIRVGLFYGNSARRLVTVAGTGGWQVTPSVLTAPAASSLQAGIWGYSVVEGVHHTPAGAQAAVSALSQGGSRAFTAPGPGGTYLVLEGPYRTLVSAQAAAGPTSTGVVGTSGAPSPAYGPGTVLGPNGVLVGSYPTETAAEAEAASLQASGFFAVPYESAGTFSVFAGGLATGTVTLSLPPGSPAAAPFVPTGTEEFVTGSDGSGFVIVGDSTMSSPLTVGAAGGSVTLDDHAYRGTLSLFQPQPDGGMTVVNTLPIEEYLYGVVPEEMSPSWPSAALEAQAVAARTFALSELGQHASQGFDVTTGVSDQAYGGMAAENPSTTAAVNDTAGEVVTYQGQLAQTVYSTDSGGATASNQNVWGGNPVPYLQGVPEPPGYQSPFQWAVTYTGSQLGSLMTAAGKPVGDVTSVAVSQRGQSGHVILLAVTGTQGTATLFGDNIRIDLGLKSTLFQVGSNADVTVMGGGGSESVLHGTTGLVAEGVGGTTAPLGGSFVAEGAGNQVQIYATGASGFTFTGQGWGHGVGMSQYGAKYQAGQGATYAQILSYYYRGTTLSPNYGTGSVSAP